MEEELGQKSNKAAPCMNSFSCIEGVGGDVPLEQQQKWTAKSLSIFAEGISIILSQWKALQIIVAMEQGIQFPDADEYILYSRANNLKYQKVEQFCSDIFIWFIQSKGKYKYLGDMLQEIMDVSFRTFAADGSTYEVAERLKNIYAECLQGKYHLVEELRRSSSMAKSVYQSTREWPAPRASSQTIASGPPKLRATKTVPTATSRKNNNNIRRLLPKDAKVKSTCMARHRKGKQNHEKTRKIPHLLSSLSSLRISN